MLVPTHVDVVTPLLVEVVDVPTHVVDVVPEVLPPKKPLTASAIAAIFAPIERAPTTAAPTTAGAIPPETYSTSEIANTCIIFPFKK